MRPRQVCLILLLASAACNARRAQPAVPPVEKRPYIITFWCGPPLEQFDDKRAAEIAAAGFNLVGPPCEGEKTIELNLQALDVASRHGLRLLVSDYRFGRKVVKDPGWRSLVEGAVSDYREHPALAGYFVVDEPAIADFRDVASVTRQLRSSDPGRLAYVNLLPDYVPAFKEKGDYQHYVERFIAQVRPRLLSVDYYPFRREGDRPSFFDNLRLLRAASARHRIPFMLIVQAMPHGSYRDPTAAEMTWQVFHAMAYGARGISYFAYWTPVDVLHAERWKFRKGLIEKGQPTRRYFEVSHLNRVVRAILKELAGFRSSAVAVAGDVSRLPGGPLRAVAGGPVTVGLFTDGRGGTAALLVNRDYRRATTARLRLRSGAGLPDMFDAKGGRWEPMHAATVALEPGSGRLVRWR